MRRIVLLDWSIEWRDYIMKAIEELGVEVLLILDRPRVVPDSVIKTLIIPNLYVDPISHRDKIIEEFKSYKIDGVFTNEDELIELSNSIAKELNLVYSEPEVIRLAMDKYATREILSNNGLSDIKYSKVKNITQLKEAINTLGLPLILKPICSSFSNGVTKIENINQIEYALERASKASIESPFGNDEFIVEEYIHDLGRVVTMEVAIINGVKSPLISTEERQNEFTLENGSKHYIYDCVLVPSRISKNEYEEIIHTTNKIIDALGINNGIIHAEYKITRTGIKLIEINPRMIGGFIPEMIKYTSGIDIAKNALNIALNNKVNLEMTKDNYGVLKFISPNKSGVIKSLEGFEEVSKLKGVVKIKKVLDVGSKFTLGETVGIGMVMCIGSTQEEVDKVAREVDNIIKIELASHPYENTKF